MGSKGRPTILDRLLEMVRGRGGIAADRTEIGDRKAERGQSKGTTKREKKQKRAVPGA